MRWHCLDPELPDKAVLRIRTAPNSAAAVCGRVSKGKAIAAVAPEFEIADDALSLAADGTAEAPQRWLHVAFLDEHTGEPTEGYVMATMPNGLRLLVPWEETNCINCCRVLNSRAQLFDGSSATAPVVGLVNEGEGVRYPYAVLGADGSRARILHDVFEDVWIDIAELEPMCVHLRHANCSALHAFYMLNDELPPEAQIAIRAFPAKDAETVALLSHGEAVEVVARSGSWLQIAPTHYENEESDGSWIMWETDAWTLLVEAIDHSSSTCSTYRGVTGDGDNVAAEHQIDRVDLTNKGDDEGVATTSANDSLAAQQRDNDDASANESASKVVAAVAESPVIGATVEPTDTHASSGGDAGSTSEQQEALPGNEISIASNSWDDRPLNVRSNRERSGTDSKSEALDGQLAMQSAMIELESSESEHLAQQTALATAGASWEDRPIRTQQEPRSEVLDNDASTNENPVDALAPAILSITDAATVDSAMVTTAEDASSDATVVDSHDHTTSNESTFASWDEVPVGGSRRNPSAWDEVPVGGSRPAASAWDEVPVGGGSKHEWEEYPPGEQREIDSAGGNEVGVDNHDSDDKGVDDKAVDDNSGGGDDDEEFEEPMAVDDEVASSATAEARDEEGMPSLTASSTVTLWDEVPVGGGGGRAASAWDEVPVGGSKRGPSVWEEYPPGMEPEVDAGGDNEALADDDNVVSGANHGADDEVVEENIATDNDNDDGFAEPMTVDDDVSASEAADAHVEVEEEAPSTAASLTPTPWDETPVGGSARAGSAWDEMPIGGGSKRGPSVWDEYPSEVETAPHGEGVLELDDLAEPEATANSGSRDASSSASWLENHHVAAAATTEACVSDHDEKGKMALAELEDEDESVGVRDDPLGEVDHDLHHQDGDSASTTLHATDAVPRCDADRLPDDEHDGGTSEADTVAAAEDMVVDDMVVDNALRLSRSAPIWNESPIKPTARFYEDTTMEVESDPIGDDDDEYVRKLENANLQMNDHMQNTSMASQRVSSKLSPQNRDAQRGESAPALKRTISGAARDPRSFAASQLTTNGSSFPPRRARKPEFTHTDADSGGLSFLLEFGLRAYCRHKQILITASDDASQALFQAVVYGDDPEHILETLTADESLCADWILHNQTPAPSAAHNLLDVLYARDSSEVPSTPQSSTPLLFASAGLRTPPHSSGARKEKIDRMFNRTPVKEHSTPTYDLIMSNADVDTILEAEFGDETCELTILGPYKYPTLSSSRSVPAVSRSPIGDFSASGSTMMRFSSTYQSSAAAVSSESESKVVSATGHPLLRDDAVVPSRSSTPPSATTVNPLKRAASAITKTPPVPVTKTASAPSLLSPTVDTSDLKPAASGLPPTSRFGVRPSSASKIGASSALRRPSPQPLGSVAAGGACAVPRPSSALASGTSGLAPRSSITGSLPKPVRVSSSSMLQRKSFLPSASPGASIPLASRRETMAGSIAQATDTSSLQARRTSFGFARPKSAVLQPKKL